MVRKNLPLILILLLAAFLRLIALGKIPAGISPDEVSQGYTAYSLLKTGKDEWGMAFPLTSFRSFLDYKAVLQTYIMIPSIAVFGLSEFALRLPSAVFGILAVLTVYLLTNELFKSKKTALFAALFVAISPWHLQFSRTALEINLSSFLFPFGLYLFLLGLKKPLFFLPATLFWAINLYSYHAAKYFEPLFFIALIFLYRGHIAKQNLKLKLSVVFLAALICLPLLWATAFGSAGARANDLLITNLNRESIAGIAQIQYLSPLNRLFLALPRVFANKATYVVNAFVTNYVSYLSPSFWFTEGGREITYSVLPGTGLLYLWFFPLILIGLYRLVRNKHPRLALLLFWLFLGIIPAALTKEGYRPNRVGALLTFWEIIAAYGLFEIDRLYRFSRHRLAAVTFTALSGITVIFYLNTYFFEYPYRFPQALSYGYRELVGKIASYPSSTPVIIDKGTNSQTFFAFYEKIDPRIFQASSAVWWQQVQISHPLYLDQLEKYQLGNLTFKTFNPGIDLVKGNLVVISGSRYSDDYATAIRDIVRYPDGSIAFYILGKK